MCKSSCHTSLRRHERAARSSMSACNPRMSVERRTERLRESLKPMGQLAWRTQQRNNRDPPSKQMEERTNHEVVL